MRFLVMFFSLCVFVFVSTSSAWALSAADQQRALEMISQNPALLNAPEVQRMLANQGANTASSAQTPATAIKAESSQRDRQGAGAPETLLSSQATLDALMLQQELDSAEKVKKLATYPSLRQTPLTYVPADDFLAKLYERQVHQELQKTLPRYGIQFFESSSEFDPSALPVPDSYIVSPKDVLGVYLYGVNSQNFSLQVEASGNLMIPRVGPVQVGGMSFADVKVLLADIVEKAYPNSGVALTMERFSSIQVTVTGEVTAPGAYNLLSLSTVKEAILSAQGVSEYGSLRAISIRRGGKVVHTVDLYDLIRKGASGSEFLLQSGDVVFVPSAHRLVSVAGMVKHRAVFELKSGEELDELIALAGGFLAGASQRGIELRRVDQQAERLAVRTIDWPKDTSTRLLDGDQLYVYPVDTGNILGVTLAGNVVRPGLREIPQGSTLGALFRQEIQRSGHEGTFLPSTYMDYLIVKRLDDMHRESLLRVNLALALQGDAAHDIALKHRDEVYVFNQTAIHEEPYVFVRGKVVSRPGKVRFVSGMGLADALNAAGIKHASITEKAFTKQDADDASLTDAKMTSRLQQISLRDTEQIFETKLSVDRQRVQVLSYGENGTEPSVRVVDMENEPDFILQPYDEVTFYNFFDRVPIATASVFGEVRDPGTYPITSESSLHDLIQVAGGITEKADPLKIELVRHVITAQGRQKIVDNITYAETSHTVLSAYDEVHIFRIPNWFDRKTVTLSGQVKYPGEYTIEDGETLASILTRAGGFTEKAFVRGAVFAREEVREQQIRQMRESMARIKQQLTVQSLEAAQVGERAEDKQRILQYVDQIDRQAQEFTPIGRVAMDIPQDLESLKNSPYNIALKDKDTLHIPSFTDTVSIMGEVLNPTTIVWRPDIDLDGYLALAGGFGPTADTKNVIVIRPDGSASNGDSLAAGGWWLTSRKSGIEKGTSIVVLPEIRTTSGISIWKDVTQIIYQLAVTAASLKTLGAL
ncbi:SLBB domain-containing protein [Chrysiogenes arsenatis]|uniref:SLBB domain-containing protein n=1 Tax=Chrysiogenes arsenatis TaxID=309797 RepID=UPI0004229742|nr:SLBB domain-containing protein [Chrysiogenes arsenatis]